jgi:hypothetical protein
MTTVPITFTHAGKEYSGKLSQVQGAGSTAVHHLTINNYFKGRLRVSAFDGTWVFDGEFDDLAGAFAAWLLFIEWIKQEVDCDEHGFLNCMLESG